jgi:hypothetical protein
MNGYSSLHFFIQKRTLCNTEEKKNTGCLKIASTKKTVTFGRPKKSGVGNLATKHHYEIKIQVNSPPPFNGMLSLPVISPLYFPELIYILHLPAHKDGVVGRRT